MYERVLVRLQEHIFARRRVEFHLGIWAGALRKAYGEVVKNEEREEWQSGRMPS